MKTLLYLIIFLLCCLRILPLYSHNVAHSSTTPEEPTTIEQIFIQLEVEKSERHAYFEKQTSVVYT